MFYFYKRTYQKQDPAGKSLDKLLMIALCHTVIKVIDHFYVGHCEAFTQSLIPLFMKLWHETYLQLLKLTTAYYISKFSSTKKKEQYRKGPYSFVFEITQKILILQDFDMSSGNRAVLKHTNKLGTALSIVLLVLFLLFTSLLLSFLIRAITLNLLFL